MIHSSMALAGLGMLSLLTLPLLAHPRGRKLIQVFLLCVVAMGLSLSLTSCGGGNNAGGGEKTTTSKTQPGTYSLVVTASNGAAKASQSLTLIVN
jgi:hypothetical protein